MKTINGTAVYKNGTAVYKNDIAVYKNADAVYSFHTTAACFHPLCSGFCMRFAGIEATAPWWLRFMGDGKRKWMFDSALWFLCSIFVGN